MIKHISCGAGFSDLLGFLGSCLDRLQKCFSVGGTGLEFSPVVPNVVYLEGAELANF